MNVLVKCNLLLRHILYVCISVTRSLQTFCCKYIQLDFTYKSNQWFCLLLQCYWLSPHLPTSVGSALSNLDQSCPILTNLDRSCRSKQFYFDQNLLNTPLSIEKDKWSKCDKITGNESHMAKILIFELFASSSGNLNPVRYLVKDL